MKTVLSVGLFIAMLLIPLAKADHLGEHFDYKHQDTLCYLCHVSVLNDDFVVDDYADRISQVVFSLPLYAKQHETIKPSLCLPNPRAPPQTSCY
ncbi:hypothetical protein [Thalassotalea maritima]|uniref:hypothetical protein n=1 Tax=Thalassotalea maritima TaxID=3242416 RepID=UPI00352861B0